MNPALKVKAATRSSFHGTRFPAMPVFPEQANKELASFITSYKIRAIEGEPSQVALTIPTDKTYADFLREAQSLSIALHTAFPDKYKANRVIWPARFYECLDDSAFKTRGSGVEMIVDGCRTGTNGKTRVEATQELALQNLKHEEDPVLVVAHTARYLLDATSIFRRRVSRGDSSIFHFLASGLDKYPFLPDEQYSFIFSSARLAPS